METIIVGFDFSSGSAYAVDLAIDIANRWQANINLVYVKERNEDESPIREEIERRNQGVAHLLRNIELRYTIREGKVATELAAQAHEDNASLVIVGTYGMSGPKNNWIGVNTYRTIAESAVPVLSLREEYNFKKDLERIIVPIDSTATTRQKLPMALKFAKTFKSHIDIVGLYTSDFPDIRMLVNNYVTQVDNYLTQNNIPHSVKYLKVEHNLTQTTLDYANELQADMIVIMTEQESKFANLLLGSFAQQMLHQSTIPVLTVRPEDLNKNCRIK